MNDVIDVQAHYRNDDDKQHNHTPPNHPPKKADSLKILGWISYSLHFIVALSAVVPGIQAGVGLLLVAVLIDLVKKPDATGTWQHSHFNWRIRSVIWAAVLYLVTAPFFVLTLFIYNPVWVLVSVWFLYRIIRGMVCMYEERAVNA